MVLLAVGCGREPKRQAVVILLDAARADRFSSYGCTRKTTPNMDALARRGALFLNHYAQATDTRDSLPCLLYSRYFAIPLFPFSPDVPLTYPRELFQRMDDEAISMPRLFAAAGFHTAAISAHSWLRGDTRFARQFDEFHDLSSTDLVDPRYAFPRAEEVVDYAITWVKAHREENFFLYLHLMDTHFPHYFEKEARAFLGHNAPESNRFQPSGEVKDWSRLLSADEKSYLDAIYDGDLRYTDHQLARLFDVFDKIGLLEHGVLAITADHGESLLEAKNRFAHGGRWYETVARVPFLLVGRGIPAGRHDYPTESVDILPTVAGRLEVSLPPHIKPDGLDLSPYLAGAKPPRSTAVARLGIRDGRYQCLFDQRSYQLLSSEQPNLEKLSGELFDLKSDPAEVENLWNREPDRVRRMLATYRSRLLRPYQRFRAAAKDEPPPGPFAINALNFEVDRELPQGPSDLSQARLEAVGAPDGWLRVAEWPVFCLVARKDGPPVTISFGIPDGEYQLDVGLRGACSLRIDHASTSRVVRARAFDPKNPLQVDTVALGPTRISGHRFVVRVKADTRESWLLLSRFGFRPIGTGPKSLAGEKARRERLKTLGYIED
jgi:arylsulfatase